MPRQAPLLTILLIRPTPIPLQPPVLGRPMDLHLPENKFPNNISDLPRKLQQRWKTGTPDPLCREPSSPCPFLQSVWDSLGLNIPIVSNPIKTWKHLSKWPGKNASEIGRHWPANCVICFRLDQMFRGRGCVMWLTLGRSLSLRRRLYELGGWINFYNKWRVDACLVCLTRIWWGLEVECKGVYASPDAYTRPIMTHI